MSEMMVEMSPGQAAYAIYSHKMRHKDRDGGLLPKWNYLSNAEQQAWEEMAYVLQQTARGERHRII